MQLFAEEFGGLPKEPKNSLGSATYSYEKDNLKIYQHSDKLVTDWSEFNIHNGKSVEFIQPKNSSSALNRVHNSRPSVIEGQLTSNGNIILINPKSRISSYYLASISNINICLYRTSYFIMGW